MTMTQRDKTDLSICKGLIRRAEQDGRELDSFLAEWLRHCEALHQAPMSTADIILVLADIDRYIAQQQGQNKHGPKELEIERQAFIRTRKEGLQVVR